MPGLTHSFMAPLVFTQDTFLSFQCGSDVWMWVWRVWGIHKHDNKHEHNHNHDHDDNNARPYTSIIRRRQWFRAHYPGCWYTTPDATPDVTADVTADVSHDDVDNDVHVDHDRRPAECVVHVRPGKADHNVHCVRIVLPWNMGEVQGAEDSGLTPQVSNVLAFESRYENTSPTFSGEIWTRVDRYRVEPEWQTRIKGRGGNMVSNWQDTKELSAWGGIVSFVTEARAGVLLHHRVLATKGQIWGLRFTYSQVQLWDM